MPVTAAAYPASLASQFAASGDHKSDTTDQINVALPSADGRPSAWSGPDILATIPMPRPGDVVSRPIVAERQHSTVEPTAIAAAAGGLLHEGHSNKAMRNIDDAAVWSLRDCLVIHPAGPAHPRVRLADTETVKGVEQVLRAATDLSRYAWWESELEAYFDIRVVKLERSAYAKNDDRLTEPLNATSMKMLIVDNMWAFLKGLYANSETFRGLANHAKTVGRIKKGGGWIIDKDWMIDIVLPDVLSAGKAVFNREMQVLSHQSVLWNIDTFPTFRYFSDKNRLVIPDIQSPPYTVAGRLNAIYEGGVRRATSPALAIVHEMTHVLTGSRDPVKPSMDRGVVEYLAQRILRESGINEPRQLIYIIPESEPGDVELAELEQYVNAQDLFLSKLFPMSSYGTLRNMHAAPLAKSSR